MSKMSDMAATIEELRTAASTINEVAAWLSEMFGDAPAEEPAAPANPALTLEQVRAVLAEKSRKGHTAEIRSLLQKYGASKLSGIDPTNYNALLTDVEGLADAT